MKSELDPINAGAINAKCELVMPSFENNRKRVNQKAVMGIICKMADRTSNRRRVRFPNNDMPKPAHEAVSNVSNTPLKVTMKELRRYCPKGRMSKMRM